MKIRLFIAVSLFVILTTITSQDKISISKFNINKIEIDIVNNTLLKKRDVKLLLNPIYEKNLIFLNNSDVKNILEPTGFVDSFKIKKTYPNILKIKIFEKKPIAILQNKKKRYFLSEKIDLIKFDSHQVYKELPYVFGNKEKFKILYNDLKKINFPFNLIKKYTLYESNRWDLETIDEKVIKLPTENYIKSLNNYLDLKNNDNFKKYLLFDYRIENQLILK